MLKAYFYDDIKQVTDYVLDTSSELLYNLAYNQLMLKPETPAKIARMGDKSELRALVNKEMLNISDIRQFERHSLTGQLLENYLHERGLELEDICCAEVTDTTVTFVNDNNLFKALNVDRLDFLAYCTGKNIQLILK